jgi:hypothetical protein
MASLEMRPLGLGELLDRAVTLFVRRFAAIVGALAVVYVPFAFVQWMLIGDIVTRHASTLTRAEWTSMGLVLALGLLVFALSRTAVALVAHDAYTSREVSVVLAYRVAAARVGAQLVALIVAALCEGIVLLIAALLFFAVGTMVAAAGGGTIAVTAAGAIPGILALAISTWLAFGYELSTIRIATGAWNPLTVLFRSLDATAFRNPWRTLLASLTLIAFTTVVPLMFSALGDALPSAVLRVILSIGAGTIVGVLTEALGVSFLVVYDIDIAVRREGIDLALALDANERTPLWQAPK